MSWIKMIKQKIIAVVKKSFNNPAVLFYYDNEESICSQTKKQGYTLHSLGYLKHKHYY